ncbi:hypothetical protein [Fulvivirga ligni]|uniref:hypothetical protein n=1 Tax=Fulvivirga ligni TaxID=2904246 RepID=UPI001F2A4650|nr:hypothetical protein [Fulvivirga ligni]UII24079.1 hypothetical protein LVD16_12705 [Fulvivirga ligni]
MMRYLFSIMIALALFACDTKDSVTERYRHYFIKYYGEDGNQEGIDFEMVDDGFLVLGNNVTNGTVFIAKTDQLGNELWHKEYGTGIETAVEMVIGASGEYVIVGNLAVSEADVDIFVWKIDDNGEILNSQTFGLEASDDVVNPDSVTIERAVKVVNVSDGGFVISGFTNSVATEDADDLYDIFTIKYDNNLQRLVTWKNIYGWDGVDEGVQALETENGYVFFGTTDHKPTSNTPQALSNMYLFPTNWVGDQTSDFPLQLYGTTNVESAADIISLRGGGYAMVGTSYPGVDDKRIYVARISSNTDRLFEKTLEEVPNVEAKSILESSNGDLLVLGTCIADNHDDIALIKLKSDGSFLWSKSFGGDDDDKGGVVKEISDGSIVFVGTVELGIQTKVCLIKVTEKGEFKL